MLARWGTVTTVGSHVSDRSMETDLYQQSLFMMDVNVPDDTFCLGLPISTLWLLYPDTLLIETLMPSRSLRLGTLSGFGLATMTSLKLHPTYSLLSFWGPLLRVLCSKLIIFYKKFAYLALLVVILYISVTVYVAICLIVYVWRRYAWGFNIWSDLRAFTWMCRWLQSQDLTFRVHVYYWECAAD